MCATGFASAVATCTRFEFPSGQTNPDLVESILAVHRRGGTGDSKHWQSHWHTAGHWLPQIQRA